MCLKTLRIGYNKAKAEIAKEFPMLIRADRPLFTPKEYSNWKVSLKKNTIFPW